MHILTESGDSVFDQFETADFHALRGTIGDLEGPLDHFAEAFIFLKELRQNLCQEDVNDLLDGRCLFYCLNR